MKIRIRILSALAACTLMTLGCSKDEGTGAPPPAPKAIPAKVQAPTPAPTPVRPPADLREEKAAALKKEFAKKADEEINSENADKIAAELEAQIDRELAEE